MKVLYILGSGHCGTTLLNLILDSHSQIIGLGEIESLDKQPVCSCGEPVASCRFWKDVMNEQASPCLRLYRRKWDFILDRNKYLRKTKGSWEPVFDMDALKQANFELYTRVLTKSGKQIIADKGYYRAELLGGDARVRPVIVHIVRDGRAVVWSYMKKYQKFLPYAWKWAAENLKVEFLRRRHPDWPYVFIRYKDLAQNPQKTVGRIYHKIGVKPEEGTVNFTEFEHHQIGGNRMRMQKKQEVKQDREWEKKMPKRHKILFNILFGWLNIYYK